MVSKTWSSGAHAFSLISPLYLPYISPISPLYLAYISLADTIVRQAASGEHFALTLTLTLT